MTVILYGTASNLAAILSIRGHMLQSTQIRRASAEADRIFCLLFSTLAWTQVASLRGAISRVGSSDRADSVAGIGERYAGPGRQ
jgi:hypothetical protein